MSTVIPFNKQLSAATQDFLNYAEVSAYPFIALVSCNLRNRKVNKQDEVIFYVIEGNDLENALDELAERDEASGLGLNDLNLDADVLQVHFQCEL